MKTTWLALVGLLLITFVTSVRADDPQPKVGFEFKSLEKVAIQSRGRVKPLDTYAREMVHFVTGETKWKGISPVEVIFSWLITYDGVWDNHAFIRVDYGPLKEKLGLDKNAKYFTPTQMRENAQLRPLLQAAVKKQQSKERLEDTEKKLVELQQKLFVIDAIVRGEDVSILPNPKGIDADWFAITALTNNAAVLPYAPDQTAQLSSTLRAMLESYTKGDAAQWNKSSEDLANQLRSGLAGGAYPSEMAMKREIHYNRLRPFRWAWAFYALAFVALLFYNVANTKVSRFASFGFLFAAFAVHTYGFALRIFISGRPPVTNMYESVIWVTWGCVLFSFIIWGVYKNAIIPAAATVFATVGLVLADNLPSVLDPNIHPLEPVLRSNFWLTIHVLTITLSYAAFALSLCIGNVVLGNFLFSPGNTKRIQHFTLYMYRAVQIGVVLLAAGTILGGVWADYSWGRFWGWDPKEVWALIALLLYLAVLHGRFAGWLQGFGFAASTVMCFLGVLMAWYGVNFVLGVGLHSYGFGSGGMAYVSAYVIAQVGFILAAYSKYRKAGGPRAAIFPK